MNNHLPIRLFVDAHTFDNEYQGSRTFIRELYTRLAQNPAFELYIGAYDLKNLATFFQPAANVHLLKFRSRSSWVRLLFDIPLLIRKHRIDYAHFQYMTPLFRNCRFIVTMHDVLFRDHPEEFTWYYRFSKTLLYKLGVTRANILTAVSSFSADAVARYLGVQPGRIQLLPMAVSEKFFQPYNKKAVQEAFAKKYGFNRFLLYVSRIEPRKNHAFLLRAFLQLRLWEQGYRLVLLGHESISSAAFEAALAGLSPYVRTFVVIRSDIPDSELLFFYQAATVFVYPSKAEGFGIPPLEAAAAGTPVICSNSSAMGDFSFFGEGHIDPLDFDQLCSVLTKMLSDPPDALALEYIREEIKRRYSWQQTAALFSALIKADSGLGEATGAIGLPYQAIEITA